MGEAGYAAFLTLKITTNLYACNGGKYMRFLAIHPLTQALFTPSFRPNSA